ncbi:MAG: Gfo/Idh/MocA family oxidoreductase [Spirochaetia bacterium]
MDSLRLGVIGTGSVVREIYQHLYFHSAYAPFMQVAAICDSDEKALRAFGDAWNIPRAARFTSFTDMIRRGGIDAVAVNTPDSMHREPTIAALEAGLDVILAKPTADKVSEAHAIIEAREKTGRFLGVDFHKREDPITKEARARYVEGTYGTLQSSVWYMIDRLLVADPNHDPRFFSSLDFTEKNSPVSFLTSHMADTFMYITRLKPIEVRAIGYRQKLPSLTPIPVQGYDLVDTTILFEHGVLCHIITGWALPNSANSLTVQSARLLFSDCMLELWQDRYGYHEVTEKGIDDRNIHFRNFEETGLVSGYGMESPGKIVKNILRFRNREIPDAELKSLFSPFSLGFYTALVCECANASLSAGASLEEGVVVGTQIDVKDHLRRCIGRSADFYYLND